MRVSSGAKGTAGAWRTHTSDGESRVGSPCVGTEASVIGSTTDEAERQKGGEGTELAADSEREEEEQEEQVQQEQEQEPGEGLEAAESPLQCEAYAASSHAASP